MAAIIFKCPNCGGELMFDPATQSYRCEYCNSGFSQEELERMQPIRGEEAFEHSQAEADGAQTEYNGEFCGEKQPGGAYQEEEEQNSEEQNPGEQNVEEQNPEKQNAEEQNTGQQNTAERGSAVVYTCPSCGAQIVTDETTAAAFCYYCHNPVVLSGQLSGEYLPDRIIPFSIDKEAARQQFLEYIGHKKFVPRAFFDQGQLEKLSGIYYPYWMYGCSIQGSIGGEATRVRVWRAGDEEYTETSIYHVERDGQVKLENMTKKALKDSDRALVEGVLPFRMRETKKFSLGYLSGFFAQRRDVEKQSLEEELWQDARQYSKNILRDTIEGYSTVNLRENQMEIREEKWQYLLLPVWVLTYAGKNGQRYYYAMNGQTGNICGKLPVDYRKLGIFSGMIGMVMFLLCLMGGYLI